MSISIPRKTAALVAAATAFAFAAGCGGGNNDSGGSGDDADEIAAVVEKALTTVDPEVKCAEVVTKGFVTTVYGDLATCKEAEVPDDDDNAKPTGAQTSRVDVDGDGAKATVTVQGGDTDGSTGTLEFEKEDGDWKVSALGVDFLRSQLEKSLASSEDDPESPFADPAVRACIIDDLGEVQDEEFRTMAYAGIAEKPTPRFVEIVTACAQKGSPDPQDNGADADEDTTSDDDGEQSLLRRQFESGIRSAAKKDGATEKQIDCVVKKLRSTISEDEIVEAVGRGKGDPDPELTQKTARAIQACG